MAYSGSSSGDGGESYSYDYNYDSSSLTYGTFSSASDYFNSEYGILMQEQMELYTNVSSIAKTYSAMRPQMPTTVDVWFIIFKTLGLSNAGVLSITSLILLQWYDPRLIWNNTVYSCNVLNLPVSGMWIPPISVLNSAATSQAVTPGSQPNAAVYFNGIVSLYILRQFDFTCTLKLSRFPFDDQTCRLSLVTLDTNTTNPGVAFSAQNISSPFRFYSQTGEFGLNNYYMTTSNKICISTACFSSLQIYFSYSRRSSYYVMTVIIPLCVLTALLALALIIPSDNSVKITVACTLMISLYSLQQTVARILPATEDAPMLSIGMATSLCLAGFCASCTIVTVIAKMLSPTLSVGCLQYLQKFNCMFGLLPPGKNQVAAVVAPVEKMALTCTSTFSNAYVPNETELSSSTDKLLFQLNMMIRELLVYTSEQNSSAKDAEKKRLKDVEQSRGWRLVDFIVNIILTIAYLVAAVTCLAVFDTDA